MFRQVDISDIPNIKGHLFLHSLPGKNENWNDFVGEMYDKEIDLTICLVGDEEINKRSIDYALSLEVGYYPGDRIEFPIKDYDIPRDIEAFLKVVEMVGKKLEEMKVVINGAGAAGIAIAKLLRCVDHQADDICKPVKDIIICDSKGVIHRERDNLNDAKKKVLSFSNFNNVQGSVKDAMKDADVFIGVSQGNILTKEDVQTMASDSIIFALANPEPEIMPDEAYAGGAAVVGTGRSDLPNQVNNVLGFPGIFRGALDARAKRITPLMKMAAAWAIAESISQPTFDMIIPPALDEVVAFKVAKAVKEAALSELI